MEYWINSNSGDYVSLDKNGTYKVHLLSRYDEYSNYIPSDLFEISPIQFKTLKGFIPIKEKKLWTRLQRINQEGRFRPTMADGHKGMAKRTEVPTLGEAREMILKELYYISMFLK